MGRTLLWITGGILVATGVLSLFFSFGAPGGDIATTLDVRGWDAVADLETTTSFPLAMMGLLMGIPLLVGLNATAWRETDGY